MISNLEAPLGFLAVASECFNCDQLNVLESWQDLKAEHVQWPTSHLRMSQLHLIADVKKEQDTTSNRTTGSPQPCGLCSIGASIDTL